MPSMVTIIRRGYVERERNKRWLRWVCAQRENKGKEGDGAYRKVGRRRSNCL